MTIHWEDDTVTLHHGHALDVARTLPTASVQTIVTSPPYFGLRDYGHDDQFGSEPTVAEYVESLVTLFAELRRALADDGTLWLNLGDSYAAASDSGRQGRSGMRNGRRFTADKVLAKNADVAPKNLIGVPWRVAFALQADGWVLRSDIIWAKPNPMPESVTDRPTKSHEHIFLLSKSRRYFYDAVAIREPDKGTDHARSILSGQPSLEPSGGIMPAHRGLRKADGRQGEGRNRRDVWEVATVPFGGAHFAVFPPELIRPCILAGSRADDVVLDPFSGSGTTGMVATQEGRRYVGIDLNADYLDLSLRSRFAQPSLGVELGA
jgi:DNA modification methylase